MRLTHYFKPDWNPALLRAQNYPCHLSVIRTDLVRKVGGFRSEFDGSQDWDLNLRVAELLPDEAIATSRTSSTTGGRSADPSLPRASMRSRTPGTRPDVRPRSTCGASVGAATCFRSAPHQKVRSCFRDLGPK